MVLIAAGGAWWLLRGGAPNANTAIVLERTVTETVLMSGRVVAADRVDLGMSIGGTVVAVPVDEGQDFEAGELLVQLDDSMERAALAQAQGLLASAQAQLKDLSVTGRARAASALAVAETQREQAQLDQQRSAGLLRAGAVTQQQGENARAALAIAQAQERRAAADLAATQKGGSQIAVAKAAVLVARAQVQQAEARVRLMRLGASNPGTVLVRSVEVGATVVPGRPLLSVSRRGPSSRGVELGVQPDERQLAVLAVGQKAAVSADAFPDQRFDARVEQIAPVVDPARGTVGVRLRIGEPPSFLRADMTVSVEVTTAAHTGLTVPATAVRGLTTGSAAVEVMGERGKPVEVPVNVVAVGRAGGETPATGDLVIVAATDPTRLHAGDVVVVSASPSAGALK